MMSNRVDFLVDKLRYYHKNVSLHCGVIKAQAIKDHDVERFAGNADSWFLVYLDQRVRNGDDTYYKERAIVDHHLFSNLTPRQEKRSPFTQHTRFWVPYFHRDYPFHEEHVAEFEKGKKTLIDLHNALKGVQLERLQQQINQSRRIWI